MSVEPYTNPDEESNSLEVSEPSMQEMSAKRKHSIAEAMENSMTLDELDRHLSEIIHRHYLPEA